MSSTSQFSVIGRSVSLFVFHFRHDIPSARRVAFVNAFLSDIHSPADCDLLLPLMDIVLMPETDALVFLKKRSKAPTYELAAGRLPQGFPCFMFADGRLNLLTSRTSASTINAVRTKIGRHKIVHIRVIMYPNVLSAAKYRYMYPCISVPRFSSGRPRPAVWLIAASSCLTVRTPGRHTNNTVATMTTTMTVTAAYLYIINTRKL
jgi:hypothetical protein